MLGDELWRVRVAAAQRVDQLLVVLGVGPPRVRWVTPKQHPGLIGKGLVSPREALASGKADQFVMKAQVGGDRLLGRSLLARLSCLHGCQRYIERPQVGQLGFGDQGPGCPDLDRLARDVHVEAILEQLGLDEGAVVHAVLDQAFLDQLPDRLADGAAADPQHLDQAGLAKLLTGWDTSIDDRLADDAADGFGGGMALETGQGPDRRRGLARGHRDHGRIVGRSTRESITKIFPLPLAPFFPPPLAGEGQGGGLTITPFGSRPSSTARTERVAWRTTSCSACKLYQAACGVTIRRG